MKSNSGADKSEKTQGGQVVQVILPPAPHRNQQLFSNHYLDVILPGRQDWQMLVEEAEPVLHDLQRLLAAYTPSEIEAQAEEDFIQPVLRRLGHTFEVQQSLETPNGTKTPDYFFYRDHTSLVANKGQKLNETLLQGRALAVGDAKYWDRPLDISLKRTGSDPFTNKNPSYQIAFYMQHSGLAWGILTNGRLWRLYHKDTAHKLDRFYEVNLPELLEAGKVENFLYFYAFFRREAFESISLGIEELRQESVAYALGIGDSLKAQVYEALRHIAQGFLDYPANNLQPDPATLKDIYDNGLIFLYRLLFMLYAEDRDLLPIRRNNLYRECYSLKHLKEDIHEDLDAQRFLLADSAMLWPRLKTLFHYIDKGSPLLNVITFNGGLFDPVRHPFLEQYAVSDQHLQQALEKLACVDGQFVDYRDLAERHLGTIYEGLLEFHLELAEASDRDWTIDLKNAKGERKATGSYYTPDYIVKYMVEETLGPILHQAVAKAKTEQEKIQAVLHIKVLDPAMGSGHFPVEATEYMARFLVEQISQSETDGPEESELVYWKRRVAQSCIYGVDLNPLAVDLAQLSLWLATVAKDRPLSFLDHHMRSGNSLLGARLTDLRVDAIAAKKSARKNRSAPVPNTEIAQPALFDEESLRQVMNTAVDLMWLIETSPAQNVDDVKKQEQIYNHLRRQLTDKYSKLADLVSSTHFGVSVDLGFWKPLADYATGRTAIAPPQFEIWLRDANTVAERHRFFHWELEFPEVFFDRHGQSKGSQGGFDAVLGNPPYIRQEELSPFKTYFAATYPETYDGMADLYVYFYQQGLRLTRAGGRMSYIVTNKWMRAGYGQPLRTFFAQESLLERLIDFGHAPIFEDAEVFPCILVLEKPRPQAQEEPNQQEEPEQQEERQVQVVTFPREELQLVRQKKASLGSYIQEHSYGLARNRFSSATWNLDSPAVDALLAKIKRVGVPLGEFAGVKPYRGMLTGLNEAFLIDNATKERLIREDWSSREIIKPCLRGQDIKRWLPESANLWMIVLKSSSDHSWPWSMAGGIAEAEELFRKAFPSVYKHLKPMEDRLRVRQDKGRYWWELRSCSYYHIFEQPKIITQDLATYSWFSLDSEGFYPLNTCYIWPTADLYLLGWLCSPIAWWICHRMLQHGINDTLRMFGAQAQTLPIAPPTAAIRAEVEQVITRLLEIAQVNRENQELWLIWLRTVFKIQEPGKRLENISELEIQTLREEVEKRLSKPTKHLSRNMFKTLKDGYAEMVTPVQESKQEIKVLERKLSDLINNAYGLTPEESALLWATAPPRMPLEKDA
jgi:type I restriction-modification system DNA methylase subunit